MIQIDHLSKQFDKVKATNNFSVNIDKGIIGLVGENGAGKSTLLRLIANVITPDEGNIMIDGHPSTSKEAKELVFFLPDNPYIKPVQSVSSIVSFYDTFYHLDRKKQKDLMKVFNLPTDRRVNTFSKGMTRQLFITIALSVSSKYLLLDEAFDGLDPLIMSKIKEEILTLREEGKTVIIASHNISALNQLADRVLLLSKGSLTKDGSVEDLASEMVKYQLATKLSFSRERLVELGFMVISFKKIGSLYHFVIQKDDRIHDIIQKEFSPIIFEEIPLDPEEIVMLNMLQAKEDR